jgi:thioredoxin 2
VPTSTSPAAKTITLRCQFCETWNRVDGTRAADRPKCGKCARPLLLDRPYTLTDDTFARTIAESELPILVDFYADWCGPCKSMAPDIDRLAAAQQGQVLVAKLNTDKSPQTAAAHGIRGIPTVMLFDRGKIVSQRTGALRLAELEAMVGAPRA